MIYYTSYNSPVGSITLASEGEYLNGLWLDGQKYFAGTISEKMVEKDDIPVFKIIKKWLDNYFAGKNPKIDNLPLKPIGSEFRQNVWKILCEIPYGETITYGEIAEKIAHKTGKEKMSAQAVGGAVGHNPISIIIPCHRVVGTNGSLTGYAGGIDKKIQLLKIENVDISKFFIPKKSTAL